MPVGTGRGPRNRRVARQPLGFDSLTLCRHSTKSIPLDFAAARVILEVFRGQRSVSIRAPADNRGFRVFARKYARGTTILHYETDWSPSAS